MSERRYISDHIEDICNAIEDVAAFIAGMSFKDFLSDKKTSNAVIRSLEVIGEATEQIPSGLRQQHPEIPWSKMAGMRDVLIHNYMGVDLKTVWKVATERLPLLGSLLKPLK
jgi:uncharacterized protein with HEPN domain